MHPGTPSMGAARSVDISRAGSRRRFLRVLTATALTLPLALAGCGGDKPTATPGETKSAEPIELSIMYWGTQPRADATNKVQELYTKKHPNVTFKPEFGPNSTYYDKLATKIAAQDAPDIFAIDDGNATEYAKRGATLDLSKYIKNKTLKTDKISKNLVEYGVIEGKQAAFAVAENTPATVYNKALLKSLGIAEPQIGWTVEQWIQLGIDVNTKSNGAVKGIMDPTSDYRTLWVWLRGQGKELYTAEGKVAATVEDVTKWFTLWSDARKKGATPAADVLHTATAGDITKQLVATKAGAASFVWSNQLVDLQKLSKDELGITASPGDPKGQFARAALYWSVSKTSKHADAAADFINFFVNDPEAAKILGFERGLSANSDNRALVSQSLTPAEQAQVKFQTEITPKFGKAPPVPPKGHNKVRTALQDAAESVQYGKATPEVAAKAFIDAAKTAVGG